MAVVAVFLLGLWSQIAATPTTEGMDVFGHLGYLVFLTHEGRAPAPGEPSMPEHVRRLRDACLGNDYVCPGSYRRWLQLSSAERAREKAEALAPDPDPRYVSRNYQAQHPPLYYVLAAWIYPALERLTLDRQVTLLAAFSVLLASLGLPALYLLLRRIVAPRAAILALLAIVWFPNLLPFLGRVTNDSLAFAIVCWLLWVIGRPTRSRSVVVAGALLLVTGCWTKLYVLTLLPVFLWWCFVLPGSAGTRRLAAGRLVLGLGIVAAGLIPLVLFNLRSTEHVLPLLEVQATSAATLSDRLAAPFRVDPIWFAGGMARNFFWCGYWSFVTPHLLYYLPLAAPLALLLRRPGAAERGSQQQDGLTRRDGWIHVGAIGGFLAGMWWHAALFTLDAAGRGLTVHSGNEGWYLNVLAGSVAVLLVDAAQRRLQPAALARTLGSTVVVMLLWNLAARLTMAVFWGGGIDLVGRSRSVRVDQFWAALFDPGTWESWSTLPGVAGPIWLTQLIPLIAASGLTGWLLWRVRAQDGEPAA